jgi:hypothetical protein
MADTAADVVSVVTSSDSMSSRASALSDGAKESLRSLGCLWFVVGCYGVVQAFTQQGRVLSALFLATSGLAYLIASVRTPKSWTFVKGLLLAQSGYILYLGYSRVPIQAIFAWGFVLTILFLKAYTWSQLKSPDEPPKAE